MFYEIQIKNNKGDVTMKKNKIQFFVAFDLSISDLSKEQLINLSQLGISNQVYREPASQIVVDFFEDTTIHTSVFPLFMEESFVKSRIEQDIKCIGKKVVACYERWRIRISIFLDMLIHSYLRMRESQRTVGLSMGGNLICYP